MRGLIVALAILVATPAFADDFGALDLKHPGRMNFPGSNRWVMRQSQIDSTPKPKFTMTYTAGIASRFGIGPGGHVDLFERRLGSGGPSAPALVGTFDNGAAMVALRWHPGE
jgi:hypothetical protein